MNRIAAIILAAGEGTRMKSDLPKVLHPIAGRAMLLHVLANVDALNPARKILVVGRHRAQLEAALKESTQESTQESAQESAQESTQESAPYASGATVEIVEQSAQRGTGHAVQQAEALLTDFGLTDFGGSASAGEAEDAVLILYGDVPLVPTETMQTMIERLRGSDAPTLVVLAFETETPTGYGRVIAENEHIVKMVEEKDANTIERHCRLCNSGLMAVNARDLFGLLARVTDANAQQEFYLTDIVNIARSEGRVCVAVTADQSDVAGVNDRVQLAGMESLWQARRRRQAMLEGATLTAPETVWFSWDTRIGRDVLIEPNVFFGPGVTIADGVTIRANCHIEGAALAAGVEVGPFARLRSGTLLEEKAKVGNFVEIKKTRLGKGAKANHLAYLGDADVGQGANIGAGTITCNYDGYGKYRTLIGERAFIGSNTALIAPVTVGNDAIVAAGSAISRDVAENDLSLARAEQQNKPSWAALFHAEMRKKRKENSGKK